jgi:hypothetical protein
MRPVQGSPAITGLLAIVLAACGEWQSEPRGTDETEVFEELSDATLEQSVANLGSVAVLVGRGFSVGTNIDLGVFAVSSSAGVQGYAVVLNGLEGKVIELVPPSAPYPYWCFTFLPNSSPNPDDRPTIFLKDVPKRKDSLSLSGIGRGCSVQSVPDDIFNAFDRGNFFGRH